MPHRSPASDLHPGTDAARRLADRLGDPEGLGLYLELAVRVPWRELDAAASSAEGCAEPSIPRRALFLLLLGAVLSEA